MLPGRLGLRFALEALFLVALALGAGLADLRPALIVLVMAVAWVLVALAEFTAERMTASPLSYLLPQRGAPPEEDKEPAWPMPEERTVVAPPEPQSVVAREQEPKPLPEPEPEPEPVPPAVAAPEPEPARLPEPEPEREPVAEEKPGEGEEGETLGRPLGGRLRSLLRRRERDEEPEPVSPPRHVKLLPRRTAAEPSRADQEVAELFGSDDSGAEERRG